jgi:2,3-dihydroxybiphenyl 1,2-dioxygenase
MPIQSLGYVGIRTKALEDWERFATGLIGLQLAERSRAQLRFRMDDRRQRVIVDADGSDGAQFFGWEAENAAALDAVAARVEAAGMRVARGERALADQRRVRDLILFHDPAGNRVEVFHGAEHASEPFRPGRTLSGFRTGALGMGHAVLTVERIDDVLPFYRDVLGFGLSDYTLKPFKAYFMHVNPRHHSLALIETGRNFIHHLMVEFYSLDDVGQAYDIALGEEGRIGVTLGRHTNDFMTSFYSNTPSGFMVECGWGGRTIEPAAWKPVEMTTGPSIWGHERYWLPPEKRAEARAMRLQNARDGLREPVQVIEGNYRVMDGVCPWWDSAKRAAE